MDGSVCATIIEFLGDTAWGGVAVARRGGHVFPQDCSGQGLDDPVGFPGYHLPLFCGVAKLIANGEWPLWDAFTYGGFPLFANPQAQVFYPPAWPFYLIAAAINERY